MDFLEPTQRLDSTESDSSSVSDQSTDKIFGKLCLRDSNKEFNIHRGENYVGRDPSQCQILLSSPSLSRIHAVIEGQKDVCTIMDKNSSNGTYKGSLKLKPNLVYALEHGDVVTFGGTIILDFSVVKECANINTTTEKENFLVPETPATSKKIRFRESGAWMIPDSQSSPLVQSNTKTKPEDTSCQNFSLESSLDNSSSFLQPSQPMSNKKDGLSLLLDAETQGVSVSNKVPLSLHVDNSGTALG